MNQGEALKILEKYSGPVYGIDMVDYFKQVDTPEEQRELLQRVAKSVAGQTDYISKNDLSEEVIKLLEAARGISLD